MKKTMYVCALALGLSALSFASDSGNTTLGVTVAPEAAITINTSDTTLAAANEKFGGYSGTTNFTYKIRTTEDGGSGAITVQVTSFGTGGPAVADLSYTCSGSGAGTTCSGNQAASTSAGTPVINFDAAAHSSNSGDSASVSWALIDRPTTVTGEYTSTATFTISTL
jgi:hypothetical protein